ncbi:MAG: M2 family metallopeptidase [Spirochaetaceae bacterium]|nr:MAG: M2 family metallopeptidase [Spirochaetaceae bacterium]
MDPVQFIRKTTEQVRPLEKAFYLAEWESAVSGSEEAITRVKDAQAAHMRFWSDPALFETAKRLYADERIDDPLGARQLKLIYLAAARNQQDEETTRRLTELESRVRQRYYNYRARIGGKSLSDNQIDQILRHSKDSREVEQVWEASKQVGQQVAEDVRELARLRNSAARSQGYRDHFHRSLLLDEIDEQELLVLFEDLEMQSQEPFMRLKAGIDGIQSERFGIVKKELRPWHYGDRFFQDGPQLGELDLDSLVADRKIERLAVATYEGMGMEVDSILSRSDLYPRSGKNQHAFCIHVDREGDIRTLNNLQASHRWAETLLHELGHGVYEQYLDSGLPWLLRAPAHTFTTEAVAILMGSLTFDPQWYIEVLGTAKDRAQALRVSALHEDRAKKLIFTRWCLTMTHFERMFYADPEADLDRIWWDCVERYQLLRRPEGRKAPDWAAKIHVALVPVYYHNYELGQLLAAQLRGKLEAATGGIVGRPAAGRWLIERIFVPGASLDWRTLIERATGEPLNPRYFVESAVGS